MCHWAGWINVEFSAMGMMGYDGQVDIPWIVVFVMSQTGPSQVIVNVPPPLLPPLFS